MVKLGIISDTHITNSSNEEYVNKLMAEIKNVFKDVDEIIHAGDVCVKSFLDKLKKIAPTKCVAGNMDKINNLETFLKFSLGKYNIGVIHILPDNLETFFDKNDLHILIFGHTHIPVIQGTPSNKLLINPGSPTKPKAPPKKPMFQKPIARSSVITLEIDEDDMLKTFIINLKL